MVGLNKRFDWVYVSFFLYEPSAIDFAIDLVISSKLGPAVMPSLYGMRIRSWALYFKSYIIGMAFIISPFWPLQVACRLSSNLV